MPMTTEQREFQYEKLLKEISKDNMSPGQKDLLEGVLLLVWDLHECIAKIAEKNE